MQALRDKWCIQIEVTNVCTKQCANCTRGVGHYPEPYFMDLDAIEKAIDSLEGFPGHIGVMGGDPAMHPQFLEICAMWEKKIPSSRRVLWTSGYKWKDYEHVIRRVFGNMVVYNDHSSPGQKHQPILVAIDDVVGDKELMWRLIDDCWLQPRWSASVNAKGGFFCEVAAALDILFGGPGGYPLEKMWWNKGPDAFRDQIRRYCPLCSAALPLPAIPNELYDMVSPGNLEKLKARRSPRALNMERVCVFDKKYTKKEIEDIAKSWAPWNHFGPSKRRSSTYLYGNLALWDVRDVKDKTRLFAENLWMKVKAFCQFGRKKHL
jgi:hypothetical protein